jgi:hypothetical protein
VSYNELEGRWLEGRRKRRAARLRARADRLDGGEFTRLVFENSPPVSVTWESCCKVPCLNTDDVGAPVYVKRSEAERMSTETISVRVDHHGKPLP